MTFPRSRFDPPIIGSSKATHKLRDLVLTLSSSEVSVLITGESGVGKEVLARNLHRFSPRSGGPFVSINCAAISPGVLESELFGHERGAFTGAVKPHAGLFEQANGGTLFLDEIGEMAGHIQAKLLRVLQEGEVRRVGDRVVRRADFRLLCATNANLAAAIAAGTFRRDLFYRIDVVEARIAPLRERSGDIEELAVFFASRAGSTARFTDEALATMRAYSWPGNIRELQNEVERILALHGSPESVTVEMLSPRFTREETARAVDAAAVHEAPLARAVGSLEVKMLMHALARSNWNKSKTARALGLSRQGLIDKIKRYGLTPDATELAGDESAS